MWGGAPTLLISWFILISFVAQAQDSTQWVINNYLENTGGKSLWEQTKTVKRSGVSMRFNGGYIGTSAEGESQLFKHMIKRNGDANNVEKNIGPGRIDSSFFCHEDGRVSMYLVFNDGTTRYEQIPGDNHDFFKSFDLQLLFFDVDPSLWSYAGRVIDADNAYYVINYRIPGVDGSQYFFDVETGYLVKNESLNSSDLIEYLDYREVKGRVIPWVMKHYRFGNLIYQRRYTDVEYSVEVLPCEEFMPYNEARGR